MICGTVVSEGDDECNICGTPVVHAKNVDQKLASAGFGALDVPAKPKPPPPEPAPPKAPPAKPPRPPEPATDPFDDDGSGVKLELDTPARRAPAGGAGGASVLGAETFGGAPTIGSGFDDPGDASPLSIEEAPKPVRPPSRAMQKPPAAEPKPAEAPAEPKAVAGPTEPDPDEDVIAKMAGYGDPPGGYLEAIPYVIHVAQRRAELKRQHQASIVRRAAAERDAHAKLSALGDALLARAGSPELAPLRAYLDPADRAREGTRLRGEAAKQVDSGAAEARRALDEKIAEAEKSIEPLRARETALLAEIQKHEDGMRRIQARLQRAEIEIRNLGTAQPYEPAETAAKRSASEAEREARRAEIATIEARIRDTNEQLGQVRREIAVKTGALATLEEERRRADSAHAQLAGTTASLASAAADQETAALIALAEEALRRRLAAPAGPLLVDPAAAATTALARATRDVALHARALDAYHRPTLMRGLTVLGTAAAIISVMLLFMVFW